MSSKKVSRRKANEKNQSNKPALFAAGIIAVMLIVFIIVSNTQGKTSSGKNVNIPTAELQRGADLVIVKSNVSATVRFYPYEIDNVYMELMAVEASDGTVRTALNTCQVCYGSGRGYYVQSGDRVICQNCGNSFSIDQIERQRNGCNPIPISEEEKFESEESITIAKAFLEESKDYFLKWRR